MQSVIERCGCYYFKGLILLQKLQKTLAKKKKKKKKKKNALVITQLTASERNRP